MYDVRVLAVSASRRAASLVYLELKRGVDSLATVAALGSLLGLLLAARGVIVSFGGCGCSKSTQIGAVFAGIAEAWVFVAFGLGLSLFAHLGHRVLVEQLSGLTDDMERVGVCFGG